MSFIVTIVHVFVSLFLMLTVLLQAGKGGGMGATFGGGSSQGSVFGGSGAGNFLSRLTTVSAAIFMLTSMTLAFLASTSGEDSLKMFSAQQRAAALDKQRLDKEAAAAYESTQPDSSAPEGVGSDEADDIDEAGMTPELPEGEDSVDDEAAVEIEEGSERSDIEDSAKPAVVPTPTMQAPATSAPPARSPSTSAPKTKASKAKPTAAPVDSSAPSADNAPSSAKNEAVDPAPFAPSEPDTAE